MPTPQQKIDDCRELFIKHDGRRHKQIEREMRERGWAKFSRRSLYFSRSRPGWIVRFGWREKLLEVSGWQLAGKACIRDSQPPTAHRQRSDPFHEWLKTISPGMTWDWRHQKYLYKKLRLVTSGECKRLMIFMPPRHGKSELVTVRYSAWRLQKDPSLNIILGSYNQKLANRFSRKIRRVLSEPPASAGGRDAAFSSARHEPVVRANTAVPHATAAGSDPVGASPMFPSARLANTVAEWETRAGGGVRAVGVGAGVTGFGAGLIVIDDPVKNRAQAESETFRENVWDWYNDDVYTRLEPGGAIILIQTRWHDDDLSGRLLKEMENGGDLWEVVSLPALAESTSTAETQRRGEDKTRNATDLDRPKGHDEINSLDVLPLRLGVSAVQLSADPLNREPGEALCPERYDEQALDKIKRQLGSYSFSALYQQRPMPIDGGLFKRGWFKNFIDKCPDGLRWARGYDLAVSTKTSADYTASFRCAKDNQGNLIIAEGFRKRIEYPEQRRYIIERMKTDENTQHGIELALHGQAFIQDLRRETKIANVPLTGINVDADKFTRALAWANLAEEGKVFLVRGAWNQDFLDEVCRFTGRGDKHDDQVDAVSLAVQMLARSGKGFYTF